LKDFHNLGGGGLLSGKYNDSLALLLSTLYPEYDWLPWKFERAPRNYWEDENNQRKYVDWVSKELNIKKMEDWYKVSVKVSNYLQIEFQLEKDFKDLGGSGLLQNRYNSSPSRLLSVVYPDYDWLPWKFSKSPKNLFNDISTKKKFLDWAGKELGIKDLRGWSSATTEDLEKLGGRALLEECNFSIPLILSTVYPDYNLEETKSKTSFYRKSQYLLKSMLKRMFPKEGKRDLILYC
jgi:hypothetical protein